MVEQTCGSSPISWHCRCPRFPFPWQHLHPWHLPSSWRDALLCRGHAAAAKARSWGQVPSAGRVAARSRRLQGYKHAPFDLREHRTYTLTPASGPPLPPRATHNPAPAFQGSTEGRTLLPGDTHRGTRLLQHSTLGAGEPGSCSTASPAQFGRPPHRVPIPAGVPAAGRAPAQPSLQHHLLLLLFPPTAARGEKGSAEGGGCWPAS